jgi:hypothetical protein
MLLIPTANQGAPQSTLHFDNLLERLTKLIKAVMPLNREKKTDKNGKGNQMGIVYIFNPSAEERRS